MGHSLTRLWHHLLMISSKTGSQLVHMCDNIYKHNIHTIQPTLYPSLSLSHTHTHTHTHTHSTAFPCAADADLLGITTDECEPIYAFRHRLDFTSNNNGEFQQELADAALSASPDNPESLLDALLQVAVCDVSVCVLVCVCERLVKEMERVHSTSIIHCRNWFGCILNLIDNCRQNAFQLYKQCHFWSLYIFYY